MTRPHAATASISLATNSIRRSTFRSIIAGVTCGLCSDFLVSLPIIGRNAGTLTRNSVQLFRRRHRVALPSVFQALITLGLVASPSPMPFHALHVLDRTLLPHFT
jgi:hypothetical protein